MNTTIKYELEDLEKIIALQTPDLASELNENQKRIDEEVERIRRTLVHEGIRFQDEQQLERYIRFHQQSVIRLLNVTVTCRENKNVEASVDKFYEHALQEFEGLLLFIQHRFEQYFDLDMPIPRHLVASVDKEAAYVLSTVKEGLRKTKVDAKLSSVIIEYMEKRGQNERSAMTYRDMLYDREFQKELLDFLSGSIPQDPDESLHMMLFNLNFNDSSFLCYYTEHINAVVSQAETTSSKIERLCFLTKMISQYQVRPGLACHGSREALKGQVIEYLSEEMNYLERLQYFASKTPMTSSEVSLLLFRLKLELSVSQLAYLLRLFIEGKIIQNQNLSELFRFFTKFTMTKRSENLSFESFRVKFYNNETGTREAVKSMLLSMVNYIDKHP